MGVFCPAPASLIYLFTAAAQVFVAHPRLVSVINNTKYMYMLLTHALHRLIVYISFWSVQYIKVYFSDVRERLCTHILYALISQSTSTFDSACVGIACMPNNSAFVSIKFMLLTHALKNLTDISQIVCCIIIIIIYISNIFWLIVHMNSYVV